MLFPLFYSSFFPNHPQKSIKVKRSCHVNLASDWKTEYSRNSPGPIVQNTIISVASPEKSAPRFLSLPRSIIMSAVIVSHHCFLSLLLSIMPMGCHKIILSFYTALCFVWANATHLTCILNDAWYKQYMNLSGQIWKQTRYKDMDSHDLFQSRRIFIHFC